MPAPLRASVADRAALLGMLLLMLLSPAPRQEGPAPLAEMLAAGLVFARHLLAVEEGTK